MKKLPLGEPAHIGELAISSRREGDTYVKQDGNSEALRYLLWEIHSNGSIVIIDINLPPLSRQKLGCIKCIFTEPIVGLILPSVL